MQGWHLGRLQCRRPGHRLRCQVAVEDRLVEADALGTTVKVAMKSAGSMVARVTATGALASVGVGVGVRVRMSIWVAPPGSVVVTEGGALARML